VNSVSSAERQDGTAAPSGPQLSRARRVMLCVELLASALLTLLFGLAACQSFAQAGRHGVTVGGGVVLVVLTLLTGWWFVRVLYRLHHPYVRVRTLVAPVSLRMARSLADRRHSPRIPSYLRNLGLGFAAMGLVALALVPVGISQMHKSSYVQTHGVLSTGTVIHAANSEYCGKAGCSWTGKIEMRLTDPVAGVTATTIHTPFATSLRTGERTTFLVDPLDPSWAEIPGTPFYGTGAWLAPVAALAFLWLLAGWSLFRWRAAVRRIRYGATAGPDAAI
jgi:hypothetical protein